MHDREQMKQYVEEYVEQCMEQCKAHMKQLVEQLVDERLSPVEEYVHDQTREAQNWRDLYREEKARFEANRRPEE